MQAPIKHTSMQAPMIHAHVCIITAACIIQRNHFNGEELERHSLLSFASPQIENSGSDKY